MGGTALFSFGAFVPHILLDMDSGPSKQRMGMHGWGHERKMGSINFVSSTSVLGTRWKGSHVLIEYVR